jgi:hypothetical protein
MKKKFTNREAISFILFLAGIGFVLLVFVFLAGTSIIGYGVKERCRLAQERYEGDCVSALIRYLHDENNGFRERNSAIWALGQLGDERALPVLTSYYTGFNGERCNRDKELSQLELKRAIGYMQGSTNVTTFFWRFGPGIDR